ncbi:MAG: endonuclease SmrB [Idiomarina loihiensis]
MVVNKRQSSSLSEDDIELFREAAKGAARIKQDKLPPEPPKIAELRQRRQLSQHPSAQQIADASRSASHYFSDDFEAHFADGPVRFAAEGESGYLVKQLRRGDYTPELLLDLHGMTLATARQELAALLLACEREHIDCCCIMHGHGSGKLKQQLPHWLVQHPHVRAFHQAPLEWGGAASLLVLLKVAS